MSTSNIVSVAKRLDRIDISTWRDEYPGDPEPWKACMGEYDLDVHVSTGKTHREAIDHLLDWFEHDNGEVCR